MKDDAESEDFLVLIKNVNDISDVTRHRETRVYLQRIVMLTSYVLPILIAGLEVGHSSVLYQGLLPSKSINRTNTRIENGEIFNRPEVTATSVGERSWIISLAILAGIPGCWCLPIFRNKFGHKKVMLVTIGVYILAWLTVTYAESTIHLIIGRSVIGICVGMFIAGVTTSQGEISNPKLRLRINCTGSMGFCAGVGIVHALGIWFHWRTIAAFSTIFSVVTFLVQCYVPDSIAWLLKKGRYHEAISSWTFSRGIRDLDELKSMHSHILAENQAQMECKERKSRFSGLFSYRFVKPFVIVMAVYITSQVSGLGAVTHYCIQVVAKIAGEEHAYLSTLIVDAFRLIATSSLNGLAQQYSTRLLLLSSAFSTAAVLILLSFSIYIDLWVPWLPLILLFAFELTCYSGLATLPWAFCSELIPQSHKDIGISLGASIHSFIFFLVLKFTPGIMDALPSYGIFLIFGVLLSIGSTVLFFILPDTHNKSLKEIDALFTRSSKKVVVVSNA